MDKLTKNDERILGQLKKYNDAVEKDFTSQSIIRVAKNLEISERTAYRSINRLTKAGKLTTKTIYKIS